MTDARASRVAAKVLLAPVPDARASRVAIKVLITNVAIVAATGSGSISLSASGAAAQPASGSAALTLGATGSASLPGSGSAALTLSATGSATPPGAGSSSLSLSGSSSASSAAIATGSVSLSGTSVTSAAIAGTGSVTLSGAGSANSAYGSISLVGGAVGIGRGIGSGVLALTASGSTVTSLSAIGTGSLTLTAVGTVATPTSPAPPPPPPPSVVFGPTPLDAGIYGGGYARPMRYETEPHAPTVYQYFVADTITGDLIAEVPLTGVQYSLAVSKTGELSGSVPVDVIAGLDLYDAVKPIKTSIFVMKNGQVMWGGIIWGRTYSIAGREVNISAGTFESYLFRRHIWHSILYPNTVDQYQVVRNLIDEMQTDFNTYDTTNDHITSVLGAANIGITYETRNSGQTQDTQLWDGGELRSFGDAITEFANNIHGFEWNIKVTFDSLTQRFVKTLTFRDTPPGQLALGETYTGVRTGVTSNIFEYPGNISDLTLDEDGTATSTRFITVGGFPDGSGFDFKPKGSFNNSGYLSSGWPIVEVIDSSNHPTTYVQATLDKYSRLGGRRTRPLVPTWTVTVNGGLDPQIGAYEQGDWCQLVVDDDFVRARLLFSGETEIVKRIMGYSVVVPDVPQEPETVNLEIEDEWVEAT